MICSGRSNFSICDAAIHIDLRELEEKVAKQIDEMLKASPPEEIIPSTEEMSAEILAVENKIERLVNALSESSDISALYISRQIEALHKEREEMMNSVQNEPNQLCQIEFNSLSFNEKKMVASEFIERILLNENQVDIQWKI